ncbi:3'-5' exonuclease domain-containing protein 2 [Desulfovibrio subterraneus]|uniref:3'-5' exonuclease n=1 Tax=Desulfovibrio subterraneus TaxID=2718620 RepID=UPI0022B8BB7C|nr:3'-5' exonuclease [Desulfovibrio subterraneus]WBF69261.1 3'-5' exonuclease domain-containing protein 2 [Desulfovibrio subterraneus]
MRKIPERYKRKITKDEINELPLYRFEGQVELVRTEEELAAAVQRMRQENLLGFDTETRPTFRKGKINLPSLVQFACSDVVYLIQLNWLPLTESVKDLLADAAIVKTGVAVRDDIKDLQRLSFFEDAGVLDLGEVARSIGLETHGLRNLAANLLDVRISKGAQCSNWASRELTTQQIQYAATDAWISREIHLRMEALGFLTIPQHV